MHGIYWDGVGLLGQHKSTGSDRHSASMLRTGATARLRDWCMIRTAQCVTTGNRPLAVAAMCWACFLWMVTCTAESHKCLQQGHEPEDAALKDKVPAYSFLPDQLQFRTRDLLAPCGARPTKVQMHVPVLAKRTWIQSTLGTLDTAQMKDANVTQAASPYQSDGLHEKEPLPDHRCHHHQHLAHPYLNRARPCRSGAACPCCAGTVAEPQQ